MPKFLINVEINNVDENLEIKPDETSDGIAIYHCFIAEEKVCQLRKNEQGNWEQLWGSFDEKIITAVGTEIEKKEKDSF